VVRTKGTCRACVQKRAAITQIQGSWKNVGQYSQAIQNFKVIEKSFVSHETFSSLLKTFNIRQVLKTQGPSCTVKWKIALGLHWPWSTNLEILSYICVYPILHQTSIENIYLLKFLAGHSRLHL
jgi:hypothetical protein